MNGSERRPLLLVEDDPDIRTMIGQLLDLEGWPVVTATNGAEALQLLRDGLQPFLILLDLMMPVMNGWQFRAEQARDPALSAIPVVVMSGDARGADRSLPERAAGYLRKPVDLDLLLATIERFAQSSPSQGGPT